MTGIGGGQGMKGTGMKRTRTAAAGGPLGRGVLAACLAVTLLLANGCSFQVAGQVKESLATELDQVKASDDAVMKKVAEAVGTSFDQLGVTGEDWAKAYLKGFEYGIGDVEVDKGKGTAEVKVTLTCRSVTAILNDFQTRYAQKAAGAGQGADEAAQYKLAGEALMEATEAAEPRKVECTLTYKKTEKDGKEVWVGGDEVEQELSAAMVQ